MAGCRIPFATRAALLPVEPEHGLFWSYDEPLISGCITFLADMNTAIKPPPSEFSYLVDGVPKTPDSLTWLNDRVLKFQYSQAELEPSIINLSFPVPHPLLRFATGVQVGSFLANGLEFEPTATGDYDDPLFELNIRFPIAMDTSVVLLTNEIIVEVDGNEEGLLDIAWADDRTLLVRLNVIGSETDDVVIYFNVPSPRLRAIDLHQSCPFILDEIEIET